MMYESIARIIADECGERHFVDTAEWLLPEESAPPAPSLSWRTRPDGGMRPVLSGGD
jgi:hypothetical protein